MASNLTVPEVIIIIQENDSNNELLFSSEENETLMSVVGGNSQTTVGISSYFRKSPQNKQTTSLTQQAIRQSSEPSTSSNSQQIEPKKTIKGIIKRSGSKLTRKNKNIESVSNNHKVTDDTDPTEAKCKDKLKTDDGDPTEAKCKNKLETDDSDPREAKCKDKLETDDTDPRETKCKDNVETDDTDPTEAKCKDKLESDDVGDTKIHAKSSSGIINNLIGSEDAQGSKIIETIVSDSNNKVFTESQDRCQLTFDPDDNDQTEFGNDAESCILLAKVNQLKSVVNNIKRDSGEKDSSDSENEDQIPIQINDKEPNDFIKEKRSLSPDSSTPIITKNKPRLLCPRLSSIFPSLDDSLPSTSFLTKPNITKTNETKTSHQQNSSNENREQSQKPKRKTRKIQIPEEKEDLPKLSLPKASKKRKQPESKSVKSSLKTKSRKITNNFEFFSPVRNKGNRSILEFVSKCKSPAIQALKKSTLTSSTSEAAKEDFDVKLIEELSVIPKIKNEANVELKRKILELDDVNMLNEEQIQMLVLESESYLRDIFQGKIPCVRHEDFKKGGKDRNNLNYQVHLDLFTDEQHDVVMETLMEMFCKNHHKYLDYLLKVLLPEILIRIYMEVKGTSYSETEEIMRNLSTE